MAFFTGSRSCDARRTFEWAVTGYTPEKEETKTVTKAVTIYQTWRYYASYGEWVTSGSPWENPSGGTNYRGSYPSAPSFSSHDGDTTTTSATGTADFTEKVITGGDPIYGWVGVGGTSHTHPPQIPFDDGTYAGNLGFNSCTASASSPSGSGSSGEQRDGTGSGTASYSGDVPLKEGGGTGDSPSVRVSDVKHNSARFVIEGIAFGANTYEYFEVEIWNYHLTVYSGQTLRWTEGRPDKYAWLDVFGLDPSTEYGFKGFVKQPGGTRNHVGNVSFKTTLPTGVRPENWEWATLVPSAWTYGISPKISLVTAKDWNDFCTRINDFRRYKGLENYSFTTVSTEQAFSDTIYQQAVNAITPMKTVSTTGGPYTKLVNLRTALNSIT